MTKYKLLSVAAILRKVIATPSIAQQAVQEPGSQAFYQSLGVGASGAGSSRIEGSYASAPSKRLTRRSAKHH
jgi:hypothetical protein